MRKRIWSIVLKEERTGWGERGGGVEGTRIYCQFKKSETEGCGGMAKDCQTEMRSHLTLEIAMDEVGIWEVPFSRTLPPLDDVSLFQLLDVIVKSAR